VAATIDRSMAAKTSSSFAASPVAMTAGSKSANSPLTSPRIRSKTANFMGTA
jgi:hypothetical protein